MPPLVSVCIVTYQHARFIADALEGALNQETDFPFEILVGEDESTDGTREICQDYARRYPDKIRVFLRHRNDVVQIDGKPRGSFNFRMTLREARGEFVALCEGDDYWTDPMKLQMQVDYLRRNPDCVGCFHDVKLIDARGEILQQSYFQSETEKFNQEAVLCSLLSREPTCSLMFRRSAFAEPLPEWYLRRPSDLYLDILITAHGSLAFIPRNMGAYRKHAGGVWSGQRDAHQIIELIVRLKLLLADSFFLGRYREILLAKIEEFQSTLFTRNDLADEVGRLERIVLEQTQALAAARAEHERLTAEAAVMRDELARSHASAQGHIDGLAEQLARTAQAQQSAIDQLRSELDKTAAVSREQTTYITALQHECGRLETEASTARRELARAKSDAQAHFDRLNAEISRLAGASQEQTNYIKILEREQNRLNAANAALTGDIDHYIKVIHEQKNYIQILETRAPRS